MKRPRRAVADTLTSTTGENIDVTCSAADDGMFTLPQNVPDRVPAGAVAEIEMERVAPSFRADGDALLVGMGTVSGVALTGAKVLIGIALVVFVLVVLGVMAIT